MRFPTTRGRSFGFDVGHLDPYGRTTQFYGLSRIMRITGGLAIFLR